MPMQCYVHVKCQFRGKKLGLPLRNFRLLNYPGILQRLQHLIIQFPLHYLLVVAYGRLKTKENFKLLALKVLAPSPTRGGRLQEVPNVVIWPKNIWYFLENWLLRRGSHKQRFNCMCVYTNLCNKVQTNYNTSWCIHCRTRYWSSTIVPLY